MRPENDFFTKANPSYSSGANAKYLQHSYNPPAKWALDILREKFSFAGIQNSEPGFNLTAEEIIKFKIWPQGVIPYYIDEFSFDKVLRDRIRNYLDLTNRATGLRFMELPRPPADEKTRWVLFVNRQGLLNCADHSIMDFTNEGVQKVVLGYDCLVTGGELAEAVLALVGVPPQHNSPDRDKYIKIMINNVMPEKRHLFVALRRTDWLFYDVPYDFLSASHYNFHKYTKNGQATIKYARNPNVNIKEENALEPRIKPNKYLGLPEVNISKSNKTKKSKTNDNIPKETIKSSNFDENDNNEEEEVVEKDYEGEDNESKITKGSKDLSKDNDF
ncbi:unnamed protein product, partial [Iphiclides podalirius]